MSNPLHGYLAHHPSFQHPSSSTSPLPSLYSDLSRQRRSNPAAYRANIEWWKHFLTQITWDGVQSTTRPPNRAPKDAPKQQDAQPSTSSARQDRLVLHLNETTKAAFTVEQVGRPLGLGTVVAELQTTSDVVLLQTFLRSNRPLTGPSRSSGLRAYVPSAGTVASTLVVKPLVWAFSQLGLSGSSADDDESEDEKLWKTHRGDWIVWANLEKVTDAFLQDHYTSASLSPLDSLFTMATFRKKLAALKLDTSPYGVPFQMSELDVEVLIKHLVRDHKVAVMDKGIVKLSPREHEPPTPITEQDAGILHIAETNAKLETQISEIERKIEERRAKAKAALRANHKNQALSYLRSRKMLEELLTKRMGSLETISGVLIKVEQAAGDIELMQAYETSTSTLKSLLAHPSLQQERVEDTMTSLSDALADHAEIDQAIQLGGEEARAAAGVEEIDEGELIKEMEALALEKEQEEEEERRREREAERRRVEEREREKEERREEERKREERKREERETIEEKQAQQQAREEGEQPRPEKTTKQAVVEE